MVAPAEEVAERLDATLVNMRFVKPLDTALLRELAGAHDHFVTVEENAVAGGAGSAVNEWLAAQGLPVRTLNLGLPDRFLEHASRERLLADCGLDAAGIEAAIRRHLNGSDAPDPTADCAPGASRLIS